MSRKTIVWAVVLVLSAGCQCTMLNPCADIGPAARGDAFPLGLALIPGGNATYLKEQLGILSGAGFSTGMCNTTLQQVLIDRYSARIAVFNLRLDRLQVLRLPYPDIIFPLIGTADKSLPPTVVVIAFRKNVYSEPAYLANAGNDTSIWGAGFVVSLALLARFNQGILANLQWYDLTCDGCGGRASQLCIRQVAGGSCATAFINCTCAGQGANCSYADSQFEQCSTSMNVGFLGTDVNSAAFQTGGQIQRLNAFSLVSLYYTAKSAILEQYNNIYSNLAGQWSSQVADAKAQQTEFGGAIGSGSRGQVIGGTPPPSPPPAPPSPPPSPPLPPPSPFPPGFGGRRRRG